MPIVGTKRSDPNSVATRELNEGNRQIKRSQTMSGDGFGNPKDLTDVSDAQERSDYKYGGRGMTIKSDKRGNPKP